MEHIFKSRCYNVRELLDGVYTFREFKKRLKLQAEQNPLMIDPNVYKGDAFEALIEVLITSSETDGRIGIKNYKVAENHQYGVDGTGEYKDKKKTIPVMVQIKYRDDGTQYLSDKDVSNFVAYSLTHHYKKDVHMVLFTSAHGIFKKTADEMYNYMLHVFGHPEICKLVDNNSAFWDRFRYEMTQTEGENDFYS